MSMFCSPGLRPLLVLLQLFLFFYSVRTAPYDKTNAKWNTNFNEEDDPTKFFGEPPTPGHTYFPSPEDWRALPIYQLITDRFADGDPLNSEKLPHFGGFEVRDHTWRHGGDFIGIMNHLDYIRGLGIRAIWISPIFQNGWNQYHQYAQRDFTLIDQRLGTLEDLRALTTAAHARGMYVIIDVVVNHMDNCYDFEGGNDFKMHTGKEHTLKPSQANCKSQSPGVPDGQSYRDFHHNNEWDPEGTYTKDGAFYKDDGTKVLDSGKGTYSKSDFHHNGKLDNYQDPFTVNCGKIYGLMDDLRTESHAVQDKHIAATKALIASADVDAFRVDTPMQVDLAFFKKWVPAVKEFAATLGKKNFGMWGEFFVPIGRYATMMGRGKDNTMWDSDKFIDDRATLNGGIEYQSYVFLLERLFQQKMPYKWPCDEEDKTKAVCLQKSHDKDLGRLDFYNPQTNKLENTMWHFCNNHDQPRMQARDDGNGAERFRMCLVWMTFWPGVPLHYAGDEQAFSTFGTALDGWAREELGLSQAWRAMPKSLPQQDNFDMTSHMYKFIQWINRLREGFFNTVLKCDQKGDLLNGEGVTDAVFAFKRGCAGGSQKGLLILVNFGPEEWKGTIKTRFPSASLVDVLPSGDPVELGDTDAGGNLVFTNHPLEPYGAKVITLVDEYNAAMVNLTTPAVTESLPKHDEVVGKDLHVDGIVNIKINLDKSYPVERIFMRLDGKTLAFKYFFKVVEGSAKVLPGLHQIKVEVSPLKGDIKKTADRIVIFTSRFRVPDYTTNAPDVTIDPVNNINNPELVSADFEHLHHTAVGASHFRVRNTDADFAAYASRMWSEWAKMPTVGVGSKEGRVSKWVSKPNVPVTVQYFSAGSSAYFTGGCRTGEGTPCPVAMSSNMYMRLWDGTDTTGSKWEESSTGTGDPLSMTNGTDYTWEATVPVSSGGVRIMFYPLKDKTGPGLQMGSIMTSTIQHSMERAGRWKGTGEESIASMAEWTQPLKVTPCCRLQAKDESGHEPACCGSDTATFCKVTFNDLTLQIKVLNPQAEGSCPFSVSEIIASKPWVWILAVLCGICLCAAIAGFVLRGKPSGDRSGERGEAGVELGGSFNQ